MYILRICTSLQSRTYLNIYCLLLQYWIIYLGLSGNPFCKRPYFNKHSMNILICLTLKYFALYRQSSRQNISYFHLFHLSDNGEIRKRNATQFSKLNLLLEVSNIACSIGTFSLSGPNKPGLYISDSEVYILHFFCFKQFNICRLPFLCSNIVSINLRMCHTPKQDTDRISHDFCPDFWHTQESVDSKLIGFWFCILLWGGLLLELFKLCSKYWNH